jgi:phosphoribosylaminoimidazole (AIR) synthetase
MFQVFNMGIGMAVILSRKDVAAFIKNTRANEIGRIEAGTGVVRLEP